MSVHWPRGTFITTGFPGLRMRMQFAGRRPTGSVCHDGPTAGAHRLRSTILWRGGDWRAGDRGAGSVVTKDVPKGAIVAGQTRRDFSPCRGG